MSDEQYIRRESVNQSTLFDYMGSTGIDVNLKMGTPGEEQLKKSSEILKKAAVHRLVKCTARTQLLPSACSQRGVLN